LATTCPKGFIAFDANFAVTARSILDSSTVVIMSNKARVVIILHIVEVLVTAHTMACGRWFEFGKNTGK